MIHRTAVRLTTLLAGSAVLAACAAQSREMVQKGGQPAPAEVAASTPPITEADLRERLYKIADDSMGGRATGSPGHIKTTDYIAAELRRLGLKPAGENGTYFQAVPFVKRTTTVNEISVGGAPLTLRTDFLAVPESEKQGNYTDADVVYGGLIDDSTTWISAEQSAGKFVILRLSSLQVLREGIPSPGRTTRFAKAAAVGITGFGPVYPQLAAFFGNPDGPVYKGEAPAGNMPVMYFLSDPAAGKLLGGSATAMQPGAVGGKVTGKREFREDPLVARNVVAVLPGTDAALRGQYVAIGAHSDHDPLASESVDHDSLRAVNLEVRRRELETGQSVPPAMRAQIRVNIDSLRALRPARRDSILNGADDDGSGTVALLEIAESMAQSDHKPKRSVLFVWHVAEELGLIGANHFTRHPTVPRDSIITALNIDMIGRGGPGEEAAGGPDYLQLIGWRRLSNELGDVIEAVNKERTQPFKFDLQYDASGHPEQYYCRSDHYMYARYGIPVAFFTTGSHADYHQVTDEPQYIDYTKLRNVTQLINDVALRVAGLPQPPRIDGEVPADPNQPCRQ